MNHSYTLDWLKYSTLAKQAAAEGCVLLKNDRQTLPILPGTKVSVFGRIAFHYYRSGTGSGGKVNVPYTHSIIDGLSESGQITLNSNLITVYQNWIKEHPFNSGNGWGQEPWAQEEMPLDEELVRQAAEQSDMALIIIGRTAGEDHDNTPSAGSYYLTETELNMLAAVRRNFSKMAVLLNVGNIIDMNWVSAYNPDSVMYIWQGGMEGGAGVADVLTGKISPCGKLTDTIARSLSDYPSDPNFGNSTQNLYQEDIYVGYRYFETFKPDCVLYPFGFGLSYTSFDFSSCMTEQEHSLIFTVKVTNTGHTPGKEIIQIYCQPPQGVLGKPSRILTAFGKTRTLNPKETQILTLTVDKSSLASFDDSGITGHIFCNVLESGQYRFYVGKDVRNAVYTDSFSLKDTLVTEQLSNAMAPTEAFTRIRPLFSPENSASAKVIYEEVPLKNPHSDFSLNSEAPALKCTPYSGDCGYELSDVFYKRISINEFLSQLTDEDLCHLVHGEGMCSPKVTPGTAGAFGGITTRLADFGIPLACCTDGPSGMRFDCGTQAFSLPNGTMLACTFNTDLVTDLFEMEGLEMRSKHVDTLLGPGINLHRHPLNGRNFEYHSEDPFLTGQMACAQLNGLHRAGVTGTVKHFCANNQESHRLYCNSVVSARALRELYLKAFEMAVKKGCASSIMTTYGAVNGIWTAGNYDQNTQILRNEWGFQGILMTDWWTWMNDPGEKPDTKNLAAMVRSQNDLYMVSNDGTDNKDNLKYSLASGKLTRAQLLRCAENICRFLLHSPAMQRFLNIEIPVQILNAPFNKNLSDDFQMNYIEIGEHATIPLSDIPATQGLHPLLALHLSSDGDYRITLTGQLKASRLAQVTASLHSKGDSLATYSFQNNAQNQTLQEISLSRECNFFGLTQYLSIYYSEGGFSLTRITLEKLRDQSFRA